MEFTSFKCDICGKLKGQANHWYWLLALPGRVVIGEWETPTGEPGAKPKHLCGRGCATKAMLQAMEREK